MRDEVDVNHCSTANTAWIQPEFAPVIRKGRRIGLLAKCANGKWRCVELIDTSQNRKFIELRLVLVNQA